MIILPKHTDVFKHNNKHARTDVLQIVLATSVIMFFLSFVFYIYALGRAVSVMQELQIKQTTGYRNYLIESINK